MESIYRFPPIDLLKKNKKRNIDEKKIIDTALIIKQTLLCFGVRVTFTGINIGAWCTRYEIRPELGVRVSKIINLRDDIRLALGGVDIRMEAPIPGKAVVGIDIENKRNNIVTIREMLETKEFREFSSNLACAVGKDVLGKPVVIELAKTPHLLIGGTTGSGKTVFINSLIMGILYKAHPNDVKMVMIDTKGVSLSIFNGIPHLLIPIVTSAEKALAALRWVMLETTERYRKFADYGARDLKAYNRFDEIDCRFPQILVIIDDLSDLMAIYKSEAEELIVRIAQISSAAGIHFVIATQRPSTDVVTGLIKANIPSRIAFSVFSSIDSRVILDEKGAEELLGNGDMLFKPLGYLKPARIQAPYVSDEEIFDVVDFFKNQIAENAENIVEFEKYETNKNVDYENFDEYFSEAGRFVIEKDKASIGMLQRIFRIGFNRASRIMDELCEARVVGEEEGTKPRRILMTMEQFQQFIEEKL